MIYYIQNFVHIHCKCKRKAESHPFQFRRLEFDECHKMRQNLAFRERRNHFINFTSENVAHPHYHRLRRDINLFESSFVCDFDIDM
jgi:hypothetical protein